MPASGGEPVSLPPEVRVDDGDLRRLQRAMRHEQRVTVAKQVGAGVAGLVSLVAVLHGILDVIESWKRPASVPVAVECPPWKETPDEPFNGVCQRLKRAELDATTAKSDAAECLVGKARLERAISNVAGDVSELERRLPSKTHVTTRGD